MKNIDKFPIIDRTRYGYIYRITNKENGYTYVGKHKIIKGENWLTYMGGGVLITASINKYGKDLFIKELIDYADTLNDLNQLEDKYIKDEVNSGKAQYNIQGAESKANIQIRNIKITDEELLYMFFDRKMSGRAIDKELNLPNGTVYYYLVDKYGEIDERFQNIRQGEIRDPIVRKRINKNLKNGAETVHIKVQCQYCSNDYFIANLSRHESVCLSNPMSYLINNICDEENCNKKLRNKTASYCREHYLINLSEDHEASLERGKKSAHSFHIKNEFFTDLCKYCVKYCKDSNIDFSITKEIFIKERENLTLKEIGVKYNIPLGSLKNISRQICIENTL